MNPNFKCFVLYCLFYLVFILWPETSKAQFISPIYYGPYIEVRGNIYVRIFVTYIDASNWTSGLDLGDRTSQIIDNLNSVFNQHGIYFIRYSSENFCSEELFNTEDYIKRTSYTTNDLKSDALNIIDTGGTGTTSGLELGIPSKGLILYGIDAALSEVLIHEVGHCFGLIHTFGFPVEGNWPVECDEDLEEEDCYTYCDLICDSPFNETTGDINMEDDCSASIPPGVISAVFRNYMAYTNPGDCRDLFTPEQIKRMRFHLINHSEINVLTASTVLPGGNISPISGDIIIESGIHEITDPLYMLPGARIIVKADARLNIYSTITAACNGMWEGIIVEGNPVFSLNPPSGQGGEVGLYPSAIIEHARCGIQLGTYDQETGLQATAGGLVSPCRGSFINCTTSFRFEPKPANSMNPNVVYAANFYLDTNYRGTEQPIFIDLSEVTLVRVRNSWFKDDRPGCVSKAIGIDGKAASIVATGNHFENLRKAIVIDQPLVGSSLMDGNSFLRCYQDIETINDFDIGAPTGCLQHTAVGVTLSGNTAGFTFKKNTFTGLQGSQAIGTRVMATQAGVGNIIFDNDYVDLKVGNRAEGDNGDEFGITYACNTHATSLDDYVVLPGGTVQTQQKYITGSAGNAATGNLFSGIPFQGSFKNFNGINQYFFYGNPDILNPEHYSYNYAAYTGVTDQQMLENNADCTPTPCTTCETLTHHEQEFYAKRQVREAKIAILGSLIDTQMIAAYKDSIKNLKSVMDRHASWAAQYYALDTVSTVIKTDSVLAWLKRSETYSGDLELLNHYFFSGDSTKFNALWSDVPGKHDLSGDYLGEFDELGLVYDLVRPVVEEEGDMYNLPEAILDSLSFWETWCSEPGFLSKTILRWNGIETEQDCDSPQRTTERQFNSLPKTRDNASGVMFSVYPNPAQNDVTISFNRMPLKAIQLAVYDVQGRKWLEQDYGSEMESLVFQTGQLPSSLYIVQLKVDGDKPFQFKLSVQH